MTHDANGSLGVFLTADEHGLKLLPAEKKKGKVVGGEEEGRRCARWMTVPTELKPKDSAAHTTESHAWLKVMIRRQKRVVCARNMEHMARVSNQIAPATMLQ